jgi:multiple sugar transport system substrate-binding protein
LFAVNWGYAWNHFQDGADSSVKDKVGVVSLPAMAGGKPASCIGGWQWAVSSFSKNKEASAKLVRWLSSPEVSKQLAIKASNLPVYPSVYQDKEVLAVNGWFADALPVVQSARSRPVTPRYSEVSEAVRVNTNAVMAGVKTPAAAVSEIENRVKRILR